jgi:hypothetical protein
VEKAAPAAVSEEVLMSGGIPRTRYMIPTVFSGTRRKNCHTPPMRSISGQHSRTKRTFEKNFTIEKRPRKGKQSGGIHKGKTVIPGVNIPELLFFIVTDKIVPDLFFRGKNCSAMRGC